MKPNWSPFDPEHDPTEEDLDRVSAAMVREAIRDRDEAQARRMERLRRKIEEAASSRSGIKL